MAYTLKATGIPASYTIKACLVVNEAGTGVQDLVSGNSITTHANVTYGTGSWNSTARKYFITTGSGSSPQGVIWNTTYPSIPWDDNTCWFYMAYEGIGSVGGDVRALRLLNGAGSVGLDLFGQRSGSVNRWTLFRNASEVCGPATSDYISTKSGMSLKFLGSSTGVIKQAAHGASLSQVYSGTDGTGSMNAGPYNLRQFGGTDTAGWMAISAYCFVMGQGTISDADLTALHTDWFTELVDAPATGNPHTKSMLLGIG